MIVSSPDTTGLDRKGLARSYVQMAAEKHKAIQAELEASTANRARFAALARQHGVTYREIAECYGVTEGAVRQLLKKSRG